jgi:acyl-coenzyme A thioesterase PaaI-like protein
MSRVLTLWNRMRDKPLGKWLFARVICWKAPYFATIAPRFEELRPGYSRVSLKQRRAVQNHIGTVHAIAACNLAELGAGTMMEASLPASMRWLPRGMSVQYLKTCQTDMTAEATTTDFDEGPARDVVVAVDMKDTHGNVVVHADINMYVSPRKKAV